MVHTDVTTMIRLSYIQMWPPYRLWYIQMWPPYRYVTTIRVMVHTDIWLPWSGYGTYRCDHHDQVMVHTDVTTMIRLWYIQMWLPWSGYGTYRCDHHDQVTVHTDLTTMIRLWYIQMWPPWSGYGTYRCDHHTGYGTYRCDHHTGMWPPYRLWYIQICEQLTSLLERWGQKKHRLEYLQRDYRQVSCTQATKNKVTINNANHKTISTWLASSNTRTSSPGLYNNIYIHYYHA